MTPEQKERISAKRHKTNMQKYGVENTGQTQKAKMQHTLFYSNLDNVQKQVQKQQNTMKEKYGYSNFAFSGKSNFHKNNPMHDSSIVQKALDTRKQNYNPAKLFESNYNKLKHNLKTIHNIILLTPQTDYSGVASRPPFEFKCNICNHQWNMRFDYGNFPKCKKCHPTEYSFSSKEEQSLVDFISGVYNEKIITSDRTLINPFGIDIYLPDKNLAVEYCGLYWHGENSGGKKYKYHQYKYIKLKEQNIQLLTIFSDEWLNKRQVVEQTILSKLKLSEKIPARKTVLKQIDKNTARNFINQYHLQDCPRISVSFGLYYNSQLVACMCFKNKGADAWELTRYCSKGSVIGGFSKLLKMFVNICNPKKIISFSDNRYSDGGVYEKNGFVAESTVPPMQYYVCDYMTKHHKLQFGKSKMIKNGYDPKLTEWEIMQSKGIDRIWECGKIKWVLFFNQI